MPNAQFISFHTLCAHFSRAYLCSSSRHSISDRVIRACMVTKFEVNLRYPSVDAGYGELALFSQCLLDELGVSEGRLAGPRPLMAGPRTYACHHNIIK